MKLKTTVFILILVIIITIESLGKLLSQDNLNNNEKESFLEFQQTFKIGTVQSLSGELSYQGKSLLDSIKLYFDLVNENGGINGEKVELIVYDDGYNPTIALEKLKTLIEDDNVKAIIGGTSVSSSLNVLDYINRKNVPYLHFGGGSVNLMRSSGDYAFFLQPTITMESMIMMEFAYNYLYTYRVAIVYQENEMGIRSRNTAREYAEHKRMGIVSEIGISADDIPKHSILTDIVNNKPDAILLFTYMSETNEILKFIRGYNINIPIILPSHNLDYVNIGMIGQENWNNSYIGRWFKSPKKKEVKDFVTVFKEHMLSYPNYYNSIGWLLSDVLFQGIKNSSFSGSIRKGLSSIYSYDFGISIRVDFDNSYNIGIDSLYFVEYNDNKFIEHDILITPDIAIYYDESAINGLITLEEEFSFENKEYILDENYSHTIDQMIEDVRNFKEIELESIENEDEIAKNIEPDSNENIEDENLDNADENINNISELISPISGDEIVEDKNNNDENYEEEDKMIPEIAYEDDLLLLYGKWVSKNKGEKLKDTKYDGDIILNLKEDNRYYMDVIYDNENEENYNGYWEIIYEETDKMLLFDQFIPTSSISKTYFSITNYGRNLEIIIIESEDTPSVRGTGKTEDSVDFKPYTIVFNRYLE